MLIRDVLRHIFSFVRRSAWFSVLQVCKLWYDLGKIAFVPNAYDMVTSYRNLRPHAFSYLLNDERIDPNYQELSVIREMWAFCQPEKLTQVEFDMILSYVRHPRVDAWKALMCCLQLCAWGGNPKMVRAIIDAGIVRVSIKPGQLVQQAIHCFHAQSQERPGCHQAHHLDEHRSSYGEAAEEGPQK